MHRYRISIRDLYPLLPHSAEKGANARRARGILLIVLTVIAISLCTGCARLSPAERSIGGITQPFEFGQTKWEIRALAGKLWDSLKPARSDRISDAEVVQPNRVWPVRSAGR